MPQSAPENADTHRYRHKTSPESRNTIRFAARLAVTAAAELIITAFSAPVRRSFSQRNARQSMANAGSIYPTGASTPILPTVPMHRAIPLWTRPISVAAPKYGTSSRAMTRNISENAAPMPPGMCSQSVRIFAAGTMSFFANTPKSQQSAMKIRRFNLERFMITPFQTQEGESVSALTPVTQPWLYALGCATRSIFDLSLYG